MVAKHKENVKSLQQCDYDIQNGTFSANNLVILIAAYFEKF
jgi:hypothetical protein